MDNRIVIKKEQSNSYNSGVYYWLKCVQCKNIFKLHGERYNRGSGLYCSRKCYFISLKGKRHSMKTEFKSGISNNKGKHNPMFGRLGPLHHHFKGIKKDSQNYFYIYKPDHPRRRKHDRYVMRTYLIAELCLNRFLNKDEIIHHIDSDPENDQWDNLYLFSRQAVHMGYHLISKYEPELILKIKYTNLPPPTPEAKEAILSLLTKK